MILTATADAAHRNQIWVGVCGEMIADPKAAILLLGFSFDEFSASPASVPDIKIAVRNARYVDAHRVAEQAIRMTSAAEIRAFLARELAEMGVPAFRCQW